MDVMMRRPLNDDAMWAVVVAVAMLMHATANAHALYCRLWCDLSWSGLAVVADRRMVAVLWIMLQLAGLLLKSAADDVADVDVMVVADAAVHCCCYYCELDDDLQQLN